MDDLDRLAKWVALEVPIDVPGLSRIVREALVRQSQLLNSPDRLGENLAMEIEDGLADAGTALSDILNSHGLATWNNDVRHAWRKALDRLRNGKEVRA